MVEISREWIENLNFGKTGFKTCVFEKYSISYSCIFFIKFNALRSFYIIMLCFSQNCFFQNFDRSKLFFDQSKLRLKMFVSLCLFRSVLDWCWINRSIFNESKIVQRIKKKKLIFTIQTHFFKSFSTFLSLYDSVKTPIQFFVIFLHSFCKVFLSQGR